MRPLLLACESRNPRLVGPALGALQKLLSNDAAGDDARGLFELVLNVLLIHGVSV